MNETLRVDNGIDTAPPPGLSHQEEREWYLARIEEIDSAKRHIRDQLSRFSHESEGQKTREDFIWIRRAKAAASHYTSERERLRKKVVDLNAIIRERRRIENSGKRPPLNLAQCFMMLTEDMLPNEDYVRIEIRAVELLRSHTN